MRIGLTSVAAGLAVALFAAGCSSSAESDEAGSSSQPTLKVVTGSPAVGHGLYYVAKNEGLFEKNGLNVEQVSGGASNASALLVSGRADVWVGATPVALPLAAQGKHVSVVFGSSTAGLTGSTLIGANGMTLDALKDKGSDCRIATTSPGTTLYGWLVEVTKSVGLKCDYAVMDNLPALTASVTNGSADAAVTLADQAWMVTEKGQAVMLINPLAMTAEERDDLVPMKPFPLGAMLGIREDLSGKSEAVARYTKALRDAAEIVHNSTPEQLAEILKRDPDFASGDAESMAVAWADLKTRTPSGPAAGQITEADWQEAVEGIKGWGLTGFSSDDPKLAYSEVVDMTYLNGAS
ncbi:ABC transporter substrate-binding protein [Rhodococcus pseudokoreensis]|uniref:ABC transporter substrate-binding protein n=1 Tax=Rhodococcus pseudokoreensis TaxID=2811421 RepID=A0A974W448_9NOCA|nr:ABC transporter substrate-binding protein [Rhodococcus pseudokoreensis]QSE90649.1 ABC transporter substrate-binding protein [Rhodococcus pseudokoreensis]